jgi:hypothetical protein
MTPTPARRRVGAALAVVVVALVAAYGATLILSDSDGDS